MKAFDIKEESLLRLAELFKIFGDATRIRILCALSEGEICVSDLAETLSMTQPAISHQLRILKNTRLVKARRDGKQIYYSLADAHVSSIIGTALEHVEEE
ncbi:MULTISPECIES: ArsR/SmtB family transcription factor [Shuttleworthella]|uniref:Transcriptional regulator, ArsR family n=1 Tax=Shuttleworthella satelles DSM 14600 TaxID=626523 RepID=C4GAQ5_9FIRM|nr:MULTISPECIES: metalloregulator ArsR/SmtB family transcription factor [Shuttleworthia]EEP28198.1 transcriptional regulator, ArsR family [Shuttleworthia satelles DSM 14600]EUB16096.1 transcriptional regulator, ArsR family [Shuttleworthia sp. MSX8B]